jgi:anaerobic magnesium-protoporphyrin IX monomethyl ester cyclase
MVDILFTHANFLQQDPKQVKKMRPYPPLATLYAAAYLRQAGYAVGLFDATFANGEPDFAQALARHQPRFVVLYEDSFNFLSKMCLRRHREAALSMAALARQAAATVIAFGPDVSSKPEIYVQHGIQYALTAEGEQTLKELLDVLTGRGQQPLEELPDLAFSCPGAASGIYETSPRSVKMPLDEFPRPAWDLVDIELYRRAWLQAHGYFSLNLVASRGCPFTCNWCAKPISAQHYAVRSPEKVAAEMAWLKHHLRPDHIWFTDDLFGLRPEWLAAFAGSVAAHKAFIPFTIQSRVDLITPQSAASLSQAGCREVWLGAESGSQKVLDAMGKGITVGQIVKARGLLKDVGIKAGFFIMFGYPGETWADILATVELVRDTLPDNIGISVCYPLPGSPWYVQMKDQIGLQTNWLDSSDLAMIFQGPYQSSFYRRLHKILHLELELRQRLAVAAGGPDPALAQALDSLNDDWQELRLLEGQSHNPAPNMPAGPREMRCSKG